MNCIKKSFIGSLFLLFFSTFLCAADDYLVTYAEGKVEYRQGASWKTASVGTLLPDSCQVRIGPTGLLELRRKNETVTVYQSGTYPLKTFIMQTRERKTSRLLAAVDGKVKNAAGEAGVRRKAAMAGVKSEQQDNPATDLAWSGGGFDPVPDGLALIAAGRYKAAEDYFLTALKGEYDPLFEPEIYYYLSYACDQNSETARALMYAEKIALDPADPKYADYVLFKSALLVKAFSFDKALKLVNAYLKDFPHGDAAQAALLLSAYCYRNTGDVARERSALERAVSLNPSSEAGRSAADILEGRQ